MDYRSKQRFIDQNIQVDIKYFNNKEGMKILMRQRMQMQQALEKQKWEINIMKDPNNAAFIEKETI